MGFRGFGVEGLGLGQSRLRFSAAAVSGFSRDSGWLRGRRTLGFEDCER